MGIASERGPSCAEHRVAANGPQGRYAPLTRWPTAILDRRSPLRAGGGRSARRDGPSLRPNIGMEAREEVVEISNRFAPINYRESEIVVRQNLCQFSLPTKVCAYNSVGRSVIASVSAEINISLCTFGDENI